MFAFIYNTTAADKRNNLGANLILSKSYDLSNHAAIVLEQKFENKNAAKKYAKAQNAQAYNY